MTTGPDAEPRTGEWNVPVFAPDVQPERTESVRTPDAERPRWTPPPEPLPPLCTCGHAPRTHEDAENDGDRQGPCRLCDCTGLTLAVDLGA